MAPKYEMVREQLLELLSGLEIGQAIPPERVLAEKFGVARMTLRRAVEDLVREGYLSRQQGSGTYLAKPKIAQQLTMTSFSEDMRRRGFVPGSRTLSLEHETAGAQLGQRLAVNPKTRVLVVSRLRLADGESMAIETLHVPEERVPGLSKRDFEDASFYDILSSRYGIEVIHGVQSIQPTVLNQEEAEALSMPEYSPAFLFERTSWDQHERVVEFVRSVYRGDRYKLTAELSPPPHRARPSTQTTEGLDP